MRALLCALAALLAIAIAGPAAATAAPATEEYDLALPEADGGSEDPGEDQAIAPAPTAPPPTSPAPEAIAPENGSGGGEPAAAGGPDDDLFGSPANERPVRNLAANTSGDGGFPALLILLAVIAATCAGFAIFRLRRPMAGSDREVDHPGSAGPEVTSGTQSP